MKRIIFLSIIISLPSVAGITIINNSGQTVNAVAASGVCWNQPINNNTSSYYNPSFICNGAVIPTQIAIYPQDQSQPAICVNGLNLTKQWQATVGPDLNCTWTQVGEGQSPNQTKS